MNDDRKQYLNQLATAVLNAASLGWLDGGKPITIIGYNVVCGPRAGAVQISAGFDAGRLLSALQQNDCAILRQLIPWQFPGEPAAYMLSRYVRIEAPWTDNLAERDIRLSDLASSPKDGRRWIAGKNELGATVTLGLNDNTPHYLIAGWTGSGKTEAMRAALVQLARDPTNSFVLVDGKFGAGLKKFEHLPGVIGPCATDVESARRALAWAVSEMRQRYVSNDHAGRIVVAIDEIQEFTGKNGDNVVIDMVSKLIRQGREVGVHCLIGTQHPTLEALSDPSIKRNLPGRIALRVEDAKASQVAVGAAQPRADWLCGAGDAYVVTPSATHRVQIAHLPLAEIIEKHCTANPRMDEYPEFDATAAGTLSDEDKAPRWQYGGNELAVAIVAAAKEIGRPALVKLLDENGLGKPGVEKAMRLLGIGRDAYQWLSANGWTLNS